MPPILIVALSSCRIVVDISLNKLPAFSVDRFATFSRTIHFSDAPCDQMCSAAQFRRISTPTRVRRKRQRLPSNGLWKARQSIVPPRTLSRMRASDKTEGEYYPIGLYGHIPRSISQQSEKICTEKLDRALLKATCAVLVTGLRPNRIGKKCMNNLVVAFSGEPLRTRRQLSLLLH